MWWGLVAFMCGTAGLALIWMAFAVMQPRWQEIQEVEAELDRLGIGDSPQKGS